MIDALDVTKEKKANLIRGLSMSKLRSINTHFWQDNYVIDLDPMEKLLFLYLLSNPQTNMLGIYELHIKRISFDTGIEKDTVIKIFDHFTEANKVKYMDGFVILRNFLKHQSYNPNMETSAIKTWNKLPLNIREDSFCEPIEKGLKGFTKASIPIAKEELELEGEIERECEPGNNHPSQKDLIKYFSKKEDMLEDDIPLEAEKFINYYEDQDWKNSSGKKIKDWKRQASTWNNNYKQFNADKLQNQKEHQVFDGGTW